MDRIDEDEVDLILVPAAIAIMEFNAYLEELGVSPSERLRVLMERLPVARQIACQCEQTLH
jgi:hypothetical protein